MKRILLTVLGVAALTTSAAGAAGTRGVTITLLSPASGTQVRQAPSSPLFTWRLSGATHLTANDEWIEVSTDPTFKNGTATEILSCNTGTGCPTRHRFNDHGGWYIQADTCRGYPPSGHCAKGISASGIYYWRVSLRGPSGFIRSRPRTFHFIAARDTNPPSVSAFPGSAKRGKVAQFRFFADDREGNGEVRLEFTLYDGHGRTLVTGHDGYSLYSSGVSGSPFAFEVTLASNFPRGTFKWCLTAYDHSENHATACAKYVIS